MRYELRIQTWDQALAETRTGLLDLPIVYCGNRASCEQYAKSCGYHWRNDKSFLCGGYWYNVESRTILYPVPLLNTDN